MSTDLNNSGKLAFSTRCLPGSAAEQQEAERLAEFHRDKALRKEEEMRTRLESAAKRDQEYLAACQAHKERMQRERSARTSLDRLRRP